jgi:hypothetical protein
MHVDLVSLLCSLKSPSIVFNAASVEWAVLRPSVIVTNVACVFQYRFSKRINVSRTNTKIIVQFVVKICFRHVSLRKIYLVVMQFMRIVSVNWRVLIIVVPFARKQLSANKVWQRPGKLVPVISPSTRCLRTCNVWSILCAMIVKRKAPACSGTFWGSSAHNVVPSIPLWNKY